MSAKRAAGSPLEQEVDQKPVTKQARKDDGVTEGVLEIAGRIGGEAAGSALLDETEQLFHDVIPDNHKKVVIGMVGLPARGKSFLARKLAYYLNWMEVKTEIFNHGEYRRKHLGQRQPAEFYDPKNDEGVQLRLMLARQALKDLLEYLRDGGHIGILDATNSSRRRRRMVEKECGLAGVKVLWVESICDNYPVVNDTITNVKALMPEYSSLTPDEVLQDFKKRIEYYRSAYTSLDGAGHEKSYSFLQLRDLGEDIVLHKIQGRIAHRICRYLMNVHTRPRAIYISRHGESQFNKTKRIGGDSGLSPAGIKYSLALKENIESFKALDELNAGECEVIFCWTHCLLAGMFHAHVTHSHCQKGMTYEEIGKEHPKVTQFRGMNKFYYRYPGGESYKDVVERLEPMLVELEGEENVLIVSHQAVCRCLLAFFKSIPYSSLPKELPYLEVPLHTVLKVTPLVNGCQIETFHLGPDAVNTHQPHV